MSHDAPTIAPPTFVVSTTTTTDGKVTLSGSVTANYRVDYSFDGINWTTAVSRASTGSWSKTLTLLDAGPHTIFVRAAVQTTVAGQSVWIYSTNVTKSVTYAPSTTVSAPTFTATYPDSGMRVTLTVTSNPSGGTLKYSITGGLSYQN